MPTVRTSTRTRLRGVVAADDMTDETDDMTDETDETDDMEEGS